MATKRNWATIYRKVPPFLRELREQAGLTQRQLATKIGQSQWWVQRSEIGSRRVDAAEFIEFCLGCGVDPREAITVLLERRC